MTEIDKVQIGRLIQSAEHLVLMIAALEKRQEKLISDVEELSERLVDIEGRFRIGKGVLFGLLLALGSGALAMRDFIKGVFGN